MSSSKKIDLFNNSGLAAQEWQLRPGCSRMTTVLWLLKNDNFSLAAQE
jgi:hypothetical protein